MLYLHAMVVNTELLLLLVQVNISGLSKKLLASCYKLLFCFLDVHMQNTTFPKVWIRVVLCQQKIKIHITKPFRNLYLLLLVYLIYNAPWQSKTCPL